MKLFIFLILVSLSSFSAETIYSDRLDLVETCVRENLESSSEYTAICEYRSKKTKNRSCAMARGSQFAFSIDCSLFDEVHPKK